MDDVKTYTWLGDSILRVGGKEYSKGNPVELSDTDKVGLEDRLGDYTPPAEQSGSSDSGKPNPVVVAEEEEAKKEKLLAALRDAYKVDPTKPPSVSSLKQALGFKVSGDEKDATWAQVVDGNKDGKSE